MTTHFRSFFNHVADIYESAPEHVRRALGLVLSSIIVSAVFVGLLIEFFG